MGKLVFYYGTMGSSKTADALMLRYQYIEKGYNVLLLKPAVDVRDGKTIIQSRIGIEATATVISKSTDLIKLHDDIGADIIIVDEVQFLTENQITQLRLLADYDIQVYCYGLRTDFSSQLFEGSKRLFEIADEVCELHSIPCDCGAKAIVNARLDDFGNISTTGDLIVLGKEDKYKPMCYRCFLTKLRGTVG